MALVPAHDAQEASPGHADPRSKLAALNDRFGGFERQLEQDVKNKKDIDDTQVNAIRDHVARLEKTLNAEIRRRVEANKALQAMFDAQMSTVQDKLEAELLEKMDTLQISLTSLNGRMDLVEKSFSDSREEYCKDMEEKNQLIAKDAELLEKTFQSERRDRRERETVVHSKLKDLSQKTQEKIDHAQQLMHSTHSDLLQDLDLAVREDKDKRFQDYLLEELAALKNGLVLEGTQRQQADDEIVLALNHYTDAIQQALRVVNQA